jgi:cytochrome c-type biogenesis protein CcmH
MKLFKILLVYFILINTSLSETQGKDSHSKITKNLRCLVCQGQSIYDSDSEFANSIKILIEKKIKDGENEKQIYDYLKNRYGEWILYEPNFSKNTYILWILPIFIFLIGGFVIFRLFIVKRKKI